MVSQGTLNQMAKIATTRRRSIHLRITTFTQSPFPIVADPDHEIVDSYGLFDLLGDDVSAPGTFVVGRDGTIESLRITDSAGGRVLLDELLPRLRDAVS
jgi:alkyl hydroperoxide reductase subunit AhpC